MADTPNSPTAPKCDAPCLGTELPASGGIAIARAMAMLYDLLATGGTADGRRFFSEATAFPAGTTSAVSGITWMSQKLRHLSFGFMMGFMRPSRNTDVVNAGSSRCGEDRCLVRGPSWEHV